MKFLLRAALLLCLLVIGSALVVPQSGLNLMEARFLWLGLAINWLKTVVPGWDMDHLAAFALLGATARVAFPRLGAAFILGALLLFAGLTEVAQIWVAGRTASVRDASLDVVGGLLGYLLAALGAWRVRGSPTPAPGGEGSMTAESRVRHR